MDSSTRSTDHMLAEEDDDFHMSGIGLQPLGKTRQSSDHHQSSEQGDKHRVTKSKFDHLIPKKHQLQRTHSGEDGEHEAPLEHEIEGVQKRRYLLWEGKNKFLCGGRIMMGVHAKHLVMTTMLLVITNCLFLLLLLPLVNIPYLFEVSVVIAVLDFVFLFLTAFTEPGIIPRRSPSKLLESMNADAREKMQYCHTCRIVRPPRAKHCRYCDNCVEVFDHHCPWTGNCVGVRNYRFFFAFVILTTLSAAICCATSIFLIVRWAEGLDKRVGTLMYVRDVVAPLLSTWSLLVFCLVGALLVFHLFLMGRSQTTNEFLRGVKPVQQKKIGCLSAVFGAIPPSKLLPMHEYRMKSDDTHDSNAIAFALDTLRNSV